jgi:predicted DNA-binding transcriptional regulator AlpA
MTYPSKKGHSELLKLSDVTDWLQVSHNWVYQNMKDGDFPKPIQIGSSSRSSGATRWDRDEIQKWLDSRPRGVQTGE